MEIIPDIIGLDGRYPGAGGIAAKITSETLHSSPSESVLTATYTGPDCNGKHS